MNGIKEANHVYNYYVLNTNITNITTKTFFILRIMQGSTQTSTLYSNKIIIIINFTNIHEGIAQFHCRVLYQVPKLM